MIELKKAEDLKHYLKEHTLTVLYFSTPNCSVCHAMKPKVEERLAQHTPLVIHIDASVHPELAGQYIVFVAPTLLVLEHDKELLRESRFIDLDRVERLLSQYTS